MKPTKEVLERELLVLNLPYTKLGVKYNVSDTCIKKWARGYGIKLLIRSNNSGGNNKYFKKCIVDTCLNELPSKRKKHGIYCSHSCQQEHEYRLYIARWQAGDVTGSTGSGDTLSKYVRKYLYRKFNNSCTCCGISSWCDKDITLEVEHIDGNSRNNLEENLTLLCPNCHSQTDSYKGKNRGKGRHSRRDRYKKGKSF